METKQAEKQTARIDTNTSLSKKLREAVKQTNATGHDHLRNYYKAGTILTVSFLSIWALKHTLSALAAAVRAYKDFRKSLKA